MKVYLPQKTHRIQFDFVFLFFFCSTSILGAVSTLIRSFYCSRGMSFGGALMQEYCMPPSFFLRSHGHSAEVYNAKFC